LLRALSNLVLNVSRDGASTTSLGNPFQCFTTLISWLVVTVLRQTGRRKEAMKKNFVKRLPKSLSSYSLHHYKKKEIKRGGEVKARSSFQ